MKTRWKILIAMGVFMVLAAASAWLAGHHRPESEVEGYKNFLRRQGEKLEISEILPPAVPAESNGAPLVREAFKLLGSGSSYYTNLPAMMQMSAPGKAIIGWMQPDIRGTMPEEYTNSWEDALAVMEGNRAGVELLTQAARYPVLDFQLDYQKGPETMLPHLAPLKGGSMVLAAGAMCDLHTGDVPSATTNLWVLLSLVQAHHGERTMISQLVRIAMANIAAAANWELLQSTNLTDGELAVLQHGWEQLEFIAGMEGACEFERAANDMMIRKLRASRAEYDRMLSGSASGGGWVSSGSWLEDAGELSKEGVRRAKRGTADYLWRESWSYTDQLHALQGMEIVLQALRTIQTNQVFQPTMGLAITNLDKLQDRFSDAGWMGEFNDWLGGPLRDIFSSGASASGSAIRRVLSAETSRRVVIVAIALKRFQLRHGNFPEKLSELTPEILPSVPADPVGGKPLRYRRGIDGTFLLYSVGENEVDDGGDVSPARPASYSTTASWNWQRGRDWVWPQPATEAKFFYDNPPK